MNNKLILHAIIMHKTRFKTKEQALNEAKYLFPNEHIKGFVRETVPSFRVRVYPKTIFNNTTFVSKKISPDISLVWGMLK